MLMNSNGAVQRQGGADTNTRNHETDLVDQAIGQHPTQVILDNRVENREAGHGDADIDQDLFTRKAACQAIDGNLGGKGGE
jgi:hypothetical protein